MKIAALILSLLVGAACWLLQPSGGCTVYKVDRAFSDFQSIGSIVKAYEINAGRYPSTEQGLRALVERPEADPRPVDWPRFCDEVPRDAWQREYQYRLLPEGSSAPFEIWTMGEDGVPGTGDDSHPWPKGTNWSGCERIHDMRTRA